MNVHVRRLRYVHDTLLGRQAYLPGWYTRELGGTPFWSNLQNFPLIPSRLLILPFKPDDAFGPAVQLAALLSAIFTFLYLRRLGIGRVGSAVAGFTFACSGFFASRVYVGHLPLLEAYCALPLLLWLVEVNLQSPREGRFAPPLKRFAVSIAAFCVAVAGHPQIPIYAFSITALYLLFRARNRRGLMIGAAMGLGIGLASFVLYPMLLLVARSTRVLALDPPPNDLAFPYGRLAAFFFPNIHGRMPPDFHGYPDPAYFWDTVCYVGWLPIVACAFLLARWVIFDRRPRGAMLFIMIVGILALAFALPAWHSLMQQIPGTILRSPSRQVYVTTFALAVAAGVGIDMALAHAKRRHWTWGLSLIALVLVAHAWDLGYLHDRKFVAALALPTADESREAELLAKHVGDGRIAIDHPIWKTYSRQIDDVGVFDSILLAKPYRALMETGGAPEKLNVQNVDGSQLLPRASQFFAAKLMLTRSPRGDLPQLAAGNGIYLYAVPNPLPRASLVSLDSAQFLPDDQIHQRLRDRSFDLGGQILLPTDTPKPQDAPPPAELPGVNYHRPSTDEIVVKLTAPSPGYLRLIETWDRGWRVSVDGGEATAPICANDTFMAVPISTGSHEVRLIYSTPGARTGLALSGLSLFGLFGLCWLEWPGRARSIERKKSAFRAEAR